MECLREAFNIWPVYMCVDVWGATTSLWSRGVFIIFLFFFVVFFSLNLGQWHDLKAYNETVEPALAVGHRRLCVCVFQHQIRQCVIHYLLSWKGGQTWVLFGKTTNTKKPAEICVKKYRNCFQNPPYCSTSKTNINQWKSISVGEVLLRIKGKQRMNNTMVFSSLQRFQVIVGLEAGV